MLAIKKITIRNFLSIGNVPQTVEFNNDDITLVLGENLDLGGNGSRNGVGKSALINAVNYGLFGQAITSIKKDNLINKTNGKNMLVVLELEKDGKQYTIERGRRPGVFRLFVNSELTNDDVEDEAQGDARITQQEIERTFGINQNLFNHLIALNTYTKPFLSLSASEQRDIIEQLFGITKLSEKAEKLKELIRETKSSIREEELKIESLKESNTRIEKTIKQIKLKQRAWQNSKKESIKKIQEEIEVLQELDIEEEINNHKIRSEIIVTEQTLKELKNKEVDFSKQLRTLQSSYKKANDRLEKAKNSVCYHCGQSISTEDQQKTITSLKNELVENESETKRFLKSISDIVEQINAIGVAPKKPKISYENIEDAYNHRSNLSRLVSELENKENEEDPYIEQISHLQDTGLQEISYTNLNELTELQEYHEFLLKLLTQKDSFIRKYIIDANLGYLNNRLAFYLEKMGLPHNVTFKSDLEVEITEFGRDLDFDNLSRGERNRLILSLSWSFRDVFESLTDSINIMFIDELIDSGLDTQGTEAAVATLKMMSRTSNKNIFIVSHKEELISRVSNVLEVIKEDGFTRFNNTAI